MSADFPAPHRRSRCSATAHVALAVGLMASATASTATEYRLRSLAIDGPPVRINQRGDIALELINDGDESPSFYRRGEVHALDTSGEVSAINSHDDVVGSFEGQSVVWSRHGQRTVIAPPAHAKVSWAVGINDAGRVAGVYEPAKLQDRCYAWTKPAGSIDLGLLPGGTFCRVAAINQASQIAGWGDDGAGQVVAFVWENNQFVALPVPQGFDGCQASAINDLGDVVGTCDSSAGGALHPVLWHAGTVVDLDPDDAELSAGLPSAINNSGLITGRLQRHDLPDAPVIFTLQGPVDITHSVRNRGDWEFDFAGDVNDKGEILTYGRSQKFGDSALVLVPRDGGHE